MTIAHVGIATNGQSGAGTTASATLAGVTAGNQLRALVMWGAASGTPTIDSVTCSGSESNLTLIGSPAFSAALNSWLQFAYLSNVQNSGDKTVTANFSASPDSGRSVTIIESSGGDTTDFYDSGTVNTASGNGESASVDVTPTVDNASVLALILSFPTNETNFTDPSGYAIRECINIAGYQRGYEKNDAGTAALNTVQVTWTGLGNSDWAMAGAAFKPLTGATSVPLTGSSVTGGHQSPAVDFEIPL